MTTSEESKQKPLWLSIEENFLEMGAQDLSEGSKEAAIHKIAGDLDDSGYNVSRHAGNMIQLRWALDDMQKVGRPFLKDFNEAIAALTLEDASDAYGATNKIITNLGETWLELKRSERREVVIGFVEKARLDLLIAKAKEMAEEEGIRYLIGEAVKDGVIVPALEITEEKLKEVHDKIAAEKAERKRVASLLAKVEGKPDDERVKHLFDNNVADELIIEMAQVDQGVLDNVKKAMEEEIKEKERLAAEAAAKKKAEAEGPPLEEIPPDQLLDFIESIREIMEFSEEEKEIRVMCEQSAIPKAIVDVAVSDPARLDELEKQAEG